MKQITKIFVLLLAFSANTLFAQAEFADFEKNAKVELISVNKKMFQMMANVKSDPGDKETQAYNQLIKKLDLLKSYETTDSSVSGQLQSAAQKYVTNNKLVELMKVSEGGLNATYYVNQSATRTNINELLMVSKQSSKNTVMLIKGNFSLDELSALTKKMNISAIPTN